jgi:hypothetical protein
MKVNSRGQPGLPRRLPHVPQGKGSGSGYRLAIGSEQPACPLASTPRHALHNHSGFDGDHLTSALNRLPVCCSSS